MSRFAYAHFCEDIRQEVGDKGSLMGIFGSAVYVDEIPATLPKLCILAFCTSPINEPIASLTMQITVNGVVVYEFSPSSEALKESSDAVESLRSDNGDTELSTRRSIGMSAVLSPFVIEGEGVVRVRFIADGVMVPAGRLLVRLAASKQSA